MPTSLLNEIFDHIISEKLTNEENSIFSKVVQKYKKAQSIDDETELANDLCELIYFEQKKAFRAGFIAAFDLMKEQNSNKDMIKTNYLHS